MRWVLGILFSAVLLYAVFVVICYLYWNFKAIHRYSDPDEEVFLTKNGNVYWGNLSFRSMIFTRPMRVAKNLNWKGLTTAQVDTDIAEVDFGKIKTHHKPNPNCINHKFEFPENVNPSYQTATLEPFESGGSLKEEEFARAVCLGLFDYLRKS